MSQKPCHLNSNDFKWSPSSRCPFLIVWCPSPHSVTYCHLKCSEFKTTLRLKVSFSCFSYIYQEQHHPPSLGLNVSVISNSLFPSGQCTDLLILALWFVHLSRTCPLSSPIGPADISLTAAGAYSLSPLKS